MAWKKISAARRKSMPKKCFLIPSKRKYVVCRSAGRRSKITCEGVLAAFRRATLQRDTNVKRKALGLARRRKCRWVATHDRR